MDQLLSVPEDEEINFLYSLVRQNPDFFQAFERVQFADTPLHSAAAEGLTQLALEILRLMPSFGTKMNADGFSPLDLAMRRGHTKTVRTMIKLNPRLVGIQGREGFTPLHYAAETGDVDTLAEFLQICPTSIEALTIRGESAAHVGVKNGKLAAFTVLLGWLKRTDRMEVLRWADFDGNTVLHLAAFSNQPKVMELIVNQVMVNVKNLEGLTSLDIVMELGDEVNGKALQILQRRHAKRGSSTKKTHKYSSVAKYFSSPVSSFEKALKLDVLLDMGLPGEMRNAIPVVAVLIATTMYQALLSPPGGFSGQPPVIINTTTPSNTSLTSDITGNMFKLDNELNPQRGDDREGKVLMRKSEFVLFTSLNTWSFAASVSMIILVLPTRAYNLLLCFSLMLFMVNYVVAVNLTSPPGTENYGYTMVVPYVIVCVIGNMKIHLIPYHALVSWISTGNNNYGRDFSEIKTLLFQSKYLRTNFQGKS